MRLHPFYFLLLGTLVSVVLFAASVTEGLAATAQSTVSEQRQSNASSATASFKQYAQRCYASSCYGNYSYDNQCSRKTAEARRVCSYGSYGPNSTVCDLTRRNRDDACYCARKCLSVVCRRSVQGGRCVEWAFPY